MTPFMSRHVEISAAGPAYRGQSLDGKTSKLKTNIKIELEGKGQKTILIKRVKTVPS